MTIAAQFATLPIELRHPRSRALGRVAQAVLLVVFGFFAWAYYSDGEANTAAWIAGVGVGVVVLIELLLRVLGRYRKLGYTIDATGVQRTRGEPWREPLAAYDGVVWCTEVRQVGGSTAQGTTRRILVSVVELRHASQPARTVRLVEQKTAAGVRAAWETAARTLGLPAVRELPGGRLLRRQHADLDKSLRRLAAEGKREVPAEAITAPPDDIEWTPAAPLNARARMPAMLRLFILAGAGVAAVCCTIAALALWTPGPLIVLLALPAAYLFREHHRFEVALVGGELQLAERLGPFTYRSWRFDPDEVEQVWMAPIPDRVMHQDMQALVVESDRRTATLRPLSRAAATWLYRFVHVALVEDA